MNEYLTHLAAGAHIVRAMQLKERLHEVRPAARMGNAEANAAVAELDANPLVREWLPKLGYIDQGLHGWQHLPVVDRPLSLLKHYFGGAIEEHITYERCVTHCTQRIPLDGLQAAWERILTRDAATTVAPYAAATLSYLLARQPGPLWTYDSDEACLVRTYAPWPVAVVQDDPMVGAILYGDRAVRMDMHAWVAACDQEPGTLIFVSATVTHSRLKQATTMVTMKKGKTLVQLPNRNGRAVHVHVPDTVSSLSTPVQGTDLHHWVLAHPKIVADLSCGQPVYHITGIDGIPDWNLLTAQLNAALLLPFAPARIHAIWAAAHDAGLVTKLTAYQCVGYQIVTDQLQAWATLLGDPGTVFTHITTSDTDDIDDGIGIADENDD